MTDAGPAVAGGLTYSNAARTPVGLETGDGQESGRSQESIQGPDCILVKILQNFMPGVVRRHWRVLSMGLT